MPAPTPFQNQSKPLKIWVLLILLAITWGSSFILIKRGLQAFSPMQVGAMRVFIAFLFLLPFWWRVKKHEAKASKLPYILIVGAIGSALPAVLFAIAETGLSSSVAGVLNSLTPLFTLLMGVLIYRNTVKSTQVLGVIIGFASAASLIVMNGDGNNNMQLGYGLLIVLATLCYAISATTVKARLAGISSVSITTMAFSFTGPFAGLYLWYSGAFGLIVKQPLAREALVYLAILGALGTAYAWFVYNYLIQSTSALFASAVTYLMPIVALLWGLADGEALGPIHVASMALILLGVWLTGR
ncbi:MAG: DMT family transporter [Chitinophagales bacterium]|nr:DMT family transporter [Chitinophagales bacterium]